MNISKLKIAWKYLTGGAGSVADYLLDVLNAALDKIDPGKREKIQAALNTAERVLAAFRAFAWLCPTKWQTAYSKTIDAVASVVGALDDLKLTADELVAVKEDFTAAVAAWKAPDDETCVDCGDVE